MFLLGIYMCVWLKEGQGYLKYTLPNANVLECSHKCEFE